MMRFIKSRSPVQNSSFKIGFNENDLVTSFNIVNIKLGHAQINYFESYCLCDLEEE